MLKINDKDVEAFQPQLIAPNRRARGYTFVDFPNLPRLLVSTDSKGVTESHRRTSKGWPKASLDLVDRGEVS
jgi:hypothetical protein